MLSPEQVDEVLSLAARRACDAVGVAWRHNNATTISIARRASVALMDSFVGPKH